MKKQISLLVASAMLLSSSAAMAAQSDEAIKSMQNAGIVIGDENGDLQLDSPVTRAEFSKLIYEVLESENSSILNFDDTSLEFSDINSDFWAYNYIMPLKNANIINGYENQAFMPNENILFKEAAKIAAVSAGIISTNKNYPLDYIAAAIDNGLMDGVQALSEQAISRSDAINIAYNIKNFLNLKTEISNAEKAKQDETNNNNYNYTPQQSVTGSTSGGSGNGSGGGGSAINSSNSTSSVPWYPSFDTEEYTKDDENIFKNPLTSPFSTFSIDVDTASYSNMRRFILNGHMPKYGSIRTEELINYFDYDYPLPEDGTPFSVSSETAVCPWNSDNKLTMISIKGDEIPIEERKPSNLVFLIDVSGSMFSENKLPLVKKSLNLLLSRLDERDTISLVTYANGTNIVLDSVNASDKETIKNAVFSLQACGGTNGYDGINKAYELAEKNLKDGNNRIILCTDGDFNIGPSSTTELEQLVTEKRSKGIFVSVLGFGTGNYKDNRMEILADKGDGNYAYIDNIKEAKKVLADEMIKTLYPIAKDVKLQVEFNPSKVKEYRLVGYENRILNNEDFENDEKDAGELGAGAVVTAFYEIVPADGTETQDFRYRDTNAKPSDELMYLKIRYKDPDGTESKLIEEPIGSNINSNPSENFKFASAAAQLGMILNDSEYKGSATLENVIKQAQSGVGEDEFGFKHEFIQLVDLIKYIN